MGKNSQGLAAPAVKRAVATPAVKRGGKVAPTEVPMSALAPTAAMLDAWHAAATTAGETYVVFGMNAAQTEAARVLLPLVDRLKDGQSVGREMCAVSACSDPDMIRLRLVSDGTVVSRGRTLNAPTAGSAVATYATRAWVLGDSLDGPVAFDLHADGRRFSTAPTAHVALDTGAVLSVAIQCGPTRDASVWQSYARLFHGGKLPDSDRATLVGAALRVAGTPEADAILAADPDAPATPAELATLATPAKPRARK